MAIAAITPSLLSMAGAAGTFGKIGSALGGLGQLASSFGGGGGIDRGANHDLKTQDFYFQKKNALFMPDYITQGAKTAGLHPLTVMGRPVSGGPTTAINNQGPDLAAMGQGVSRALNAGGDATKRKLDNLMLEKAKLENDYLKTQIAGSVQALNHTGATVADRNDVRLRDQKSNSDGLADGIAPKHKIVRNTRGENVRVLNTEAVGDNEILMLLDAITTTLPDEGKAYIKRAGRAFKQSMSSKNSPGGWIANKFK